VEPQKGTVRLGPLEDVMVPLWQARDGLVFGVEQNRNSEANVVCRCGNVMDEHVVAREIRLQAVSRARRRLVQRTRREV
jgi:hypothetical protein